MSHCLKKMFDATSSNSYNFWYYQSLLEKPYTNLQEYCNKRAWLRELEAATMLMIEEDAENVKTRKDKGRTKWS